MQAKYIELTAEQDEQLRDIENNSLFREKVRVRARVVRLSNRGMSSAEIASYTGRKYRSIMRDLERFELRGIEGLVDGTAPGNRSSIAEEHRQWLRQKLEEDINHNAYKLAEQLRETFGIRANRESVRVCLRDMGYSWQRNRYVPVKTVDKALLVEHKASLETLKRGHKKAGSS